MPAALTRGLLLENKDLTLGLGITGNIVKIYNGYFRIRQKLIAICHLKLKEYNLLVDLVNCFSVALGDVLVHGIQGGLNICLVVFKYFNVV